MFIACQNINHKPCNSADLSALQAFLSALRSDIKGWSSNSSSDKNTGCCNWTGISCDSSTGRVIGVDLQSMNLQGNISPSLAGLDQLTWLNLSNNSLVGNVPNKLFSLPKLKSLDVSYNSLSGTDPIFNGSSNLEIFDVSSNLFDGPLNPTICNYSSHVKALRYSDNLFTGDFPIGFVNCRSIEELRLDSNMISGSIPGDLFKLTNLRKLYLQDNQLSGQMSNMFSNLSNLLELDISDNLFQGNLPDIFSSLKKLEIFSAKNNNFRGLLPSSLANLASLKILLLNNNSLNDEINLNCSAMARLRLLDLGTNLFSGPINALDNCLMLRTLNLARNNLTGKIPSNFRKMKLLSYISLSGNNFYNLTLALSILQDLPNLITLVLTRNFFDGEHLPSDIVGFQDIEVFVIANCHLFGAIPTWIANLAKLKVLDLSWNHLNSFIPPQIGNLDSLFYLDLSNNSLSGDLPSSLTTLKSLVSGNNEQQTAEADYFILFLRPNTTGKSRQYNQINHFPPSIVLHNNLLTGRILPGFGNLKNLHVLDLGFNRLSGAIPDELSGMSSLEALYLSHNDLSGGIPSTLVNLNFLSRFRVEYNNLTGEIPTGGQFSTFECSDFEGNPNLHGFPCNPYHSSTSSESVTQEDGFSQDLTTGAVVGLAIGVNTGIAIGALVPLCGRAPSVSNLLFFLFLCT